MNYKNHYDREIEHALPIGLLMLAICLVAGGLAYFLYQKSAEEIGNGYEVVQIEVTEKWSSKTPKNSTKYYIKGKTEEGYEDTFWLSQAKYEALVVGDYYKVYRYQDYYNTTLSSIVEDNAGIPFMLLQLITIMALPSAVVFFVIGIVQKWKESRRWRRRGRR